MKIKIFPLLLLTVLTLCVSSCGGKTTDKERDNSAKNEEVGLGDDAKQESEQKDCLLYYKTGDYSVGSMYLIDENGNKKRYLSDTVQEVLEKNNLASAVKDGLQAQYLYINEIVYVSFSGGLEDNRAGLYAIDPDNGRLAKVTDNGDIDYIDYYNGKLYVGFYGDEINTESVFTVSDDFSFIQGESEYVEALKNFGEYYIEKTPYKESDGYHIAKAGFSLARAFDEAGYVMATRYGQTGKNEYIKILPDGTAEAIECLSDGLREILYYDKDIVYCTGAISDAEVYSVDISTGNSKLILDDIGSGYRQVADNKLLHSDRKGENLYVFDLKKEEDKQLYPLKKKAEGSIYDSFRCQIINGKVFVCDLKDAEIKWFRVGGHDDNKSGYIVDDINCPIEVVDASCSTEFKAERAERAISAAQEVTYSDYKSAYIGFLKVIDECGVDEYGYPGGSYSIYDIDKDSIPELIVHYGECEANYHAFVFTYTDNKVKYIDVIETGHSEFYAYPSGNGILQYWAHMGGEAFYNYSLNNNILTSKEIYSGGTTYEDPETGEVDVNFTPVRNVVPDAYFLTSFAPDNVIPIEKYEIISAYVPSQDNSNYTFPNNNPDFYSEIIEKDSSLSAVSKYSDTIYKDVHFNDFLRALEHSPSEVQDITYADLNSDNVYECIFYVSKKDSEDSIRIILSKQGDDIYAYYDSHYMASTGWGDAEKTDITENGFFIEEPNEHCFQERVLYDKENWFYYSAPY